MSDSTTLKILYSALHGTLPYEYDGKYVNGIGQEDTIVIINNDTGHAIYITANTPDDNNVFNVTLYDDIHDDDPTEFTIWDANDPNLTLIDLISYIKKNL